MAKFIKSKFRVLWSTIFTFFAGIFSMEAIAQDADANDGEEANEETKKDEALDPGAIAAAVAAAAALIAASDDDSAAILLILLHLLIWHLFFAKSRAPHIRVYFQCANG